MTTTLDTTTTTTTTATSSRLRTAGGIAGLLEAACYIAGFGLLAVYLEPEGFLDHEGDAAGQLQFLLDHQTSLYLWNLVIYLMAGSALVVLVLALHDQLRRRSPALSWTATSFGLIWSGLVLASGMVSLVGQRSVADLAESDRAQAASTWTTVQVVQDGLGGGIELVGALWVLPLVVAGLRTGLIGRGLCGLGMLVGAAGTLTVVPSWEVAAAVFGLGFIVWFAWAGVALLRGSTERSV